MLGEVEISVTNFCYRPKTTDRLIDKIHKGEDFPLSDACEAVALRSKFPVPFAREFAKKDQ
jgi:hypothetical protein